MSRDNGFTPTEKRIMAVLNDGRPHTKAELKCAIDDDAPHCVEDVTLQMHLSNIRKKLEPVCKGVMCTESYGTRYQLVKTMTPPYEEMSKMGIDPLG